MASILGPDKLLDLCAGVEYTYQVIDCAGCLSVKWSVSIMPAGVDEEDIYFSAPESLTTAVVVPIEGRYVFTAEVCKP